MAFHLNGYATIMSVLTDGRAEPYEKDIWQLLPYAVGLASFASTEDTLVDFALFASLVLMLIDCIILLNFPYCTNMLVWPVVRTAGIQHCSEPIVVIQHSRHRRQL